MDDCSFQKGGRFFDSRVFSKGTWEIFVTETNYTKTVAHLEKPLRKMLWTSKAAIKKKKSACILDRNKHASITMRNFWPLSRRHCTTSSVVSLHCISVVEADNRELGHPSRPIIFQFTDSKLYSCDTSDPITSITYCCSASTYDRMKQTINSCMIVLFGNGLQLER